MRAWPRADRAACEKAIASWTAAWCLELKAASPDRQVAQIRPRSADGTRRQSVRHIRREGSIRSSQPMTGQRLGPDDNCNRAPPGPLPGPDGKARRAGRSRSRSVIPVILTFVAERNLTRGCPNSLRSGAHARRRALLWRGGHYSRPVFLQPFEQHFGGRRGHRSRMRYRRARGRPGAGLDWPPAARMARPTRAPARKPNTCAR